MSETDLRCSLGHYLAGKGSELGHGLGLGHGHGHGHGLGLGLGLGWGLGEVIVKNSGVWDEVAMGDLYTKMGDELRSLFRDLFDPRLARTVKQKMGKIMATAHQIGGSIEKEAHELSREINRYLEHPSDPKLLILMKEHALRLEQETREI